MKLFFKNSLLTFNHIKSLKPVPLTSKNFNLISCFHSINKFDNNANLISNSIPNYNFHFIRNKNNSRSIFSINKVNFSEKKEERENFDDDKQFEEELDNNSRKTIFIYSFAAIVVALAYYSINSIVSEKNKQVQVRRSGKVTYVGKANIGGHWQLINTEGEEFGSSQLRGKYYLIYFGFTRCPDVCPMSMTKIAKTLKNLRENSQSKYYDIEAIFVSCDPDRDTLEKIKQYCGLFSKDIIGVTGKSNEDENLKKMLKDFKIHASKIYLSKEDEEREKELLERNVGLENSKLLLPSKPEESNYSVDHTIVSYLIGQNNQFLSFLSSNLNVQEMTNICLESIMDDISKNLNS